MCEGCQLILWCVLYGEFTLIFVQLQCCGGRLLMLCESSFSVTAGCPILLYPSYDFAIGASTSITVFALQEYWSYQLNYASLFQTGQLKCSFKTQIKWNMAVKMKSYALWNCSCISLLIMYCVFFSVGLYCHRELLNQCCQHLNHFFYFKDLKHPMVTCFLASKQIIAFPDYMEYVGVVFI